MARPRIPEEIAAQILYRNEHVCCMCRTPNKDVQIHHIDSNPTNNSFDNLTVLCLDCHSRVTGPRGLGRAYGPREVRLNKNAWETFVLEKREGARGKVAHERELVSQIDLLVCEFLALPEGHVREAILLDQINHLHRWRGGSDLDAKIVEGLRHAASVSLSAGQVTKALPLPFQVWQMCWEFVGPKLRPMDHGGATKVLQCIDVINLLMVGNAGSVQDRRLHSNLVLIANEFVNLGVAYQDHEIASGVLGTFKDGLELGRSGAGLFIKGQIEVLRGLGETASILEAAGEEWSVESRLANEIRNEYGLVFFVVSSKAGDAALQVQHPVAGQSLVMPVFPNDGVIEAAPLLSPEIQHYVRQWSKCMVEDPEETDARGFVVEARHISQPIAASDHARALSDIASRNLSDDLRAFYGSNLPALVSETATDIYQSNLEDIVEAPAALGILSP